MTDLIDRQAAIDALNVGAEFLRRVLDETDIVGAERAKYEWGLGLIESYISDIEELSSAQPEIVRCKDCKYWMPHSQLGFDEDNGTYHDYCEKLIPEDEYYAFYRDADDYCSRAEGKTDEADDIFE